MASLELAEQIQPEPLELEERIVPRPKPPDHARRAKVMNKLFANVPRGFARAGIDEQDLRSAIEAHPESIPLWMNKKGPRAFKSLMLPEAESHLRGQKQPLLFGPEALLPLLERAVQGEAIQLNIGMSAAPDASPMLPAYLELGIQRLAELLKVGVNARLRVFSTASLAPSLNGADEQEMMDAQAVQRKLLERYLDHFYPENLHGQLSRYVDLADLEQRIPEIPEDRLEWTLARLREVLPEDVRVALEACGEHHGGAVGQENALIYAAYHPEPAAFQDFGEQDGIFSIGGRGEVLFNAARWALAEGGKVGEQAKANVGFVVPDGLIGKTPPYLRIEAKDGKPGGIRMDEFMEGSERVDAFMMKPKGSRHFWDAPGARDLLHISRCLAGKKGFKQDPGLKLRELRQFYIDNQDIL